MSSMSHLELSFNPEDQDCFHRILTSQSRNQLKIEHRLSQGYFTKSLKLILIQEIFSSIRLVPPDLSYQFRDVDDPDTDWSDWSLEVHHSPVHPSPASSSQDQYVISLSGGEQTYAGYHQDGFNSFMSSTSKGTKSDSFYTWFRKNNTHQSERINESYSEEEEVEQQVHIQEPMEEIQLQQQQQGQSSPNRFLTSDIEATFEVVSDSSSDSSSNSSSRTARPGYKRVNPE
ncbi:uncharacterized protein LOC113293772 [Papaver somniferum]|uniref:uncharacterized protein LOC113293772 n=1 Tax=Papaver somniferum TaxID=3469 RepID=UPI000E6FEEC3|nr:uncharacterized protein LOC113293772 [Papaver somniferum]